MSLPAPGNRSAAALGTPTKAATAGPTNADIPKKKIRIVLEGFLLAVTANDLCRQERIKLDFYYEWSIEFVPARKERLTRDRVWDATQDIERV